MIATTLCTFTDHTYSMKRVCENNDLVMYFKNSSALDLIESTRLVARIFRSLKVKRTSWEYSFNKIGFDKIISIMEQCGSKKEALSALRLYKKDSRDDVLLVSEIKTILEILVNLEN